MIIGKSIISELMKKDPPLVENIKSDIQMQEDGIDLTIGEILIPKEAGIIDFDNDTRKITQYCKISPKTLKYDKRYRKGGKYNYYQLIKGVYIVKLNESVHIPRDMVAIVKPRSSLVRNGIGIDAGLWDSGYNGACYIKLNVDNDYGIKFSEDARICQMIFLKIEGDTAGYKGIFQGKV